MPRTTDQARVTTEALRGILGDALRAVYLHGSAVSGDLRPQSDIDLLAVVDRALSEDRRRALLARLLRISGRHPAGPGRPRCVEVMVFRLSDLAGTRFPARCEFTYGEWLRGAFERGEGPAATHDPEHTLVLAQAREEAVALFGPDASELLPAIPPEQVRRAMRAALPALLEGLQGDERNVLLTLARMWRTARTGEFVTKDAAAEWAIPRLGHRDAATLDHARRVRLGEVADDWSGRREAVRQLAAHLADRVVDAP